MRLEEFFEEQTGHKAPIFMTVSSIYPSSRVCECCVTCGEHCPSCWNVKIKEEFKSDLILTTDYLEKMSNFETIYYPAFGREYCVDCYGNKIRYPYREGDPF